MSYFLFCNVLHIWTNRAIPTYRVYQLYGYYCFYCLHRSYVSITSLHAVWSGLSSMKLISCLKMERSDSETKWHKSTRHVTTRT